jgi:hypothetical protein
MDLRFYPRTLSQSYASFQSRSFFGLIRLTGTLPLLLGVGFLVTSSCLADSIAAPTSGWTANRQPYYSSQSPHRNAIARWKSAGRWRHYDRHDHG